MAYQCSVGIGYSVIPVPDTARVKPSARGPDLYYRLLSNKASTTLSLWMSGSDKKARRIDRVASPIVRQANLDYRAVLPLMHTRTVLKGDAGVLWTPARGSKQALFSYRKTAFPVPAGTVYTDQTTGQRGRVGLKGLPGAPWHTYVIGA